MTLRVSVALATYQGERFLEQQLASLTRQTLLPAELVVSDDGSDDRTLEIVEAFRATSPFPVRLHRNVTPLGVGDNFLTAAALCTCPLIAFSDQDDVWLAEKLERCAAALSEPGVHLAIHSCRVVDEQLRATGESFPSITTSCVAEPLTTHKWFQSPGMAMVFSRELLSVLDWRNRPRAHEPGRVLLHDEWLYGVARLVGKIAFLAEPLALYRQHGANVEGAPPDGPGRRLGLATSLGHTYYAARARQAVDWSALLDAAATATPDPELQATFRREAESYARLARSLERRASVYAAGRRGRRLQRLAVAARCGAYTSRKRDGFGVRGLLRDGLMIVLGRHG